MRNSPLVEPSETIIVNQGDSITTAINSVSKANTLIVVMGDYVYSEDISIGGTDMNGLMLVRQLYNGQQPTISGDVLNSIGVIDGAVVGIYNNTIEDPTGTDTAGIYLSFAVNNLIQSNTVSNNTNYGIYTTDVSSGNVFINNTVQGNGIFDIYDCCDNKGGLLCSSVGPYPILIDKQ